MLPRIFSRFGFDVSKMYYLRFIPRFLRERRAWLRSGGKIDGYYMILSDYQDSAGTASGHYFHQDLLVARLIYDEKPNRHIDIGSRVDGFVAHLASFRDVEVLDVRPLTISGHPNLKFIQADLMQPQTIGQCDSVSCLHVVEHFGLGRYADSIEVDGHMKGIQNLVDLVSPGGRLYLSVPIGNSDRVLFNAHRIFDPMTILQHPSISNFCNLERFDFVDDFGNLHTDVNLLHSDISVEFGCGIYTLRKKVA